MRKQTTEDLRLINQQRDMLNGNICRICVADDESEINIQLRVAIQRLREIARISSLRFIENIDVEI